ncbi:MAG: GNAT family N-acetyltransferase [Oscillospiraceae bacterium]|nr:GNAT family N-acetyltransferase [Oscillospiraceae bacterium]
MVRYVEKAASAEEFNALTMSVGWGTRDLLIIEKALKNTIYAVSVYDDEKIIGFGRLIGDAAIFLYIQDIMVVPEYQGRRIGTQIMNYLIKKVNELKKFNPEIRTYCGASAGKELFYRKFGFQIREEAGLGAGMVLF